MAKRTEKSSPTTLMPHDMPLTHFWTAFGSSVSARNAEIAAYLAKRADDNLQCALEVAKSNNPASSIAMISSNRQRAFADTAILMGSMMGLPQEVGNEVAELLEGEARVMGEKNEKLFDEVPV